MKKILLIALIGVLFSCQEEKKISALEYVSTLVGTDSDFSLSNGNTYPAIALPWGMNFWTPQTGKMGDGWCYSYSAKKLLGFKQTHQPSPWINDYAAFSIMAVSSDNKVLEANRASWFSHKTEIAKPHYYKVYLADPDVWVEITPTERAAQFRFTCPQSDSLAITVDAFNQGSFIQVLAKERKIIGYCSNNHGGVPEGFHNYFVMYFDKDFSAVHSYTQGGANVNYSPEEVEGDHVVTALRFNTKKGEKINVRVASSFISYEQAELNLQREVGKDSFDQTLAKAEKVWNDNLSRVEVEGGTDAQKRTFYSCLYRTMLFPRKFYELDKRDSVVHYSPYNGKVLPGYMFTDNGFWDTFRAVFPYFTIMEPTLTSHIMAGLANTYKESGFLPEWASPGHRGCMIGSNSASLIADAYLKGIRGFDINTLYEAIIKNTENVGPINSVGRFGYEYYNKLGYVPYDVKINENAARTLEYAYDDFSIWKLAKALNKSEQEIEKFHSRALNYKNVFDKSVGFMRGRNQDGSFQTPFNPTKWGDAFTEGCSWHYTWCVFQDPKGLANLMGGYDAFNKKLDQMFDTAPTFDNSYYGFTIHEIQEMINMGFGQYAHGNQPVQHAVYLYNYSGQPWKTQYWVRQIMDKLYTANADGYCGDEDNGQTSAWYVFSAMGFYPVCPTSGEYALGSPLFDKVTLHLENGEKFIVKAIDNNTKNIYVNNVKLGFKNAKNYLTHEQIMKGGTLRFKMTDKPNTERGTKESDYPYSMTK